MKSALNPNVKEGVNKFPNHYTYASEAPLMFISKEHKPVQIPMPDGTNMTVMQEMKGRTFVKPETLLKRKLKHEQSKNH